MTEKITVFLTGIKGNLSAINFWNHFFNVGSGKEFRLSYYNFEKLMFETFNYPKHEYMFETNWFISRNFHGMFFLDSDKLEQTLGFREKITQKEYFRRMRKQMNFVYRFPKILKFP